MIFEKSILDFSKENMYRFSFNLRGKAESIKKDAVNVRVIYLNVVDKKIENRCYNWFYYRPNNNWEQKNIIIISPDNKNPWNKAEITIFFEPGQYDVGDMRLEAWHVPANQEAALRYFRFCTENNLIISLNGL